MSWGAHFLLLYLFIRKKAALSYYSSLFIRNGEKASLMRYSSGFSARIHRRILQIVTVCELLKVQDPWWSRVGDVVMAQSIPSVPIPPSREICWALVILLVPAVGNLSENLCPGRVAFVDSNLEAINIVPFSLFHLKICLFATSFPGLFSHFLREKALRTRLAYLDTAIDIFYTYALKRYAWFSLHHQRVWLGFGV